MNKRTKPSIGCRQKAERFKRSHISPLTHCYLAGVIDRFRRIYLSRRGIGAIDDKAQETTSGVIATYQAIAEALTAGPSTTATRISCGSCGLGWIANLFEMFFVEIPTKSGRSSHARVSLVKFIEPRRLIRVHFFTDLQHQVGIRLLEIRPGLRHPVDLGEQCAFVE
jgi:hypothetical protein